MLAQADPTLIGAPRSTDDQVLGDQERTLQPGVKLIHLSEERTPLLSRQVPAKVWRKLYEGRRIDLGRRWSIDTELMLDLVPDRVQGLTDLWLLLVLRAHASGICSPNRDA